MRTWIFSAATAVCLASVTFAARPAPQAPAAPAQTPASPRRGGPDSFPAQQRATADPAVVERGRTLYAAACSACHGADARGGQLGGPNLLRSVLVLTDQNGELIVPVVQKGRPGTAMVAIPMAEPDIIAVAAYLHSLQGASRGQGAPPPGPPVELDIVVGDVQAGAAYFKQKCVTCHSATGDLAGVASRAADARALQNSWVTGRGSARGRAAGAPDRRTVTATIRPTTGAPISGRLVRMDDFLVTIALADGSIRSFRRDGDRPRVVVNDPLEGHRALLAVLNNKNMRDVTAYLVTLK